MMKIFLDTAIIEEIEEASAWGILDGVTTNPTHAKKAGADFEQTVRRISQIIGDRGTVSAETIATDAETMIEEARIVAGYGDNIVAKIPFCPEGLKAVRQLKDEGIRSNVTLVFSAMQGLLAMKAGAFYVSPFVGRIDDGGQDGMEVVEQLVQIRDIYDFETEVLSASLRHTQHLIASAMAGADIATMPFDVLKKSMEHSLNTAGMKRFIDDWQSIPENLRPF